ncbi:MAG: TolC family protein [Bacteroidota bacterium]
MRTANYQLILLLLLLLGSNGLAAQRNDLTLAQAIDYAIANNPEMKAALLNVTDADEQIKEFRSQGMPQLNGSAGYTYYFERPIVQLPMALGGDQISFILRNNFTGALNLDALIFDASYLTGLKAARAARNYAQLELADQQRNVRAQVRNAYLTLLFLTENLAQLDKNITNLTTLFAETQATYEAGFVEQLDVDRLELSLSNLRTERQNLSRQYEMAVEALKFTLNYPAGEELTVTDDLEGLLTDADAAMLEAELDYSRRTELNLIQQGLALQDLNVQVNQSRYWPSLRGNAAYQYQYQGNDSTDDFWAPTGLLGVSLNVPIYDGGLRSASVARAKLAREQVVLQQSTLQRAANLEVTNAKTAYQSALDRLRERDRNLELAQRIYDTTQVKYREGVGSSLEVSQAESELYTAQSNRLQAQFELLQAKITLQEALGL